MIMRSDIKKQTNAILGPPTKQWRSSLASSLNSLCPSSNWRGVVFVAFIVGMMAIFASTQVQAVPIPGVYEYFAGTVTDQNGDPISDATVQINEVADNTDNEGSFGFHVERDDQDRYVINVTKRGYTLVSQIEHAPNVSLRFTLKQAEVFIIDPSQTSKVEDSRGTRIMLPPNSLVDLEGNPPDGDVQMGLYTYDLANESMPGDMGAINSKGRPVSMLSGGAFYAEFTDDSGRKYNLASDMVAEISIPAINNKKRVGLWSYDETTGKWMEDGSASQINGRFEGRVKHFSAWNFDWHYGAPACVKLEIDQAFFNHYNVGGVLQIKTVVTTPGFSPITRLLSMNTGNYAGPHALYNLPPNATVDFYVPPPFSSPPYASVSTGAAWGGTSIPPYPYNVCNGGIVLNFLNDVIIDFGSPYGIWAWMNNSTWVNLHPLSANSMVTGDMDGNRLSNGLDDVIIDFGSPYGIWAWMNNSTWVNLHSLSANSMITGDMDGNGLDDVIIDFVSPYGIWVRMNNSTWVNLHSLSANSMTTGDIDGNGLDDVIIDFVSPHGIWVRMNNSTWVNLHSLSANSMTTGDMDGNGLDDVIIDFGSAYGIWVRMNNSTWVNLHPLSANSMTTGDMDGNGLDDVIIDFGSAYGIWVRMNNSTWVNLHPLSAKSMTTGDLDNNAQADVIIDFGPAVGIWVMMNNSTWVNLHSNSADSMVTGNIDRLP